MSLAAYIPIIGPAIEKLLNLIPDPNERARGEAEFQKSLLAALTAEDSDNRAINKVEAAHSSIFVSGWRPFIGWVCGAALAFQYLIRPFWIWAATIWWPGSPVPPTLDGMLWELVMGMLGIGGLRTIEKWKGVAR
ncbi:3TM-type holin [uncultured Desulfovibrio sp.]|uniref:3TM-type holin n=1 Tax=uncultured Desulfovibrio sp. TaxID=167968 RepID=UPI002612C7D8|nr:3TM-type holin [uncultured Desulfovibrio sp.]